MSTKVCSKCGIEKPIEEFYFRNDIKSYEHACKSCRYTQTRNALAKYKERDKRKERKRNLVWRTKNSGSCSLSDRKARLKRNYGITLQAYERQAKEQKGVCAICGSAPRNTLVVDHDHINDTPRGLLCNACNVAIGMVHENIESLRKIIWYLEKGGVWQN